MRTSTTSAGSWRRVAAAIFPTRRSISPRPTRDSGPTTSGPAPPPKALRPPRAKNPSPTGGAPRFSKEAQAVPPASRAMHTPGHTVGHTSFVVNSGGKSLFVVGDLMHHVILVERPRMEVGFDTDPKQGIETRIKVMDMLAAQRMPALVYHLPWPGIGHF